jgi:3-hydroxyisobutyrate dehydrogenase-like beta-hydroxyacid dehydrogenase
MAGSTIGLLHPGEMGSTVGASLVAGGARVVWSRAGRSDATEQRAEAAGLEAVDDLRALVDAAHAIVCVCPPDAASDVASEIRDAGFAGLYVDANAVSPDTARAIEAGFERSGVDFVDGGIIGPPALQPGSTRLYLSGERAAEAAAWFDAGPLEAIVVPGAAGAASALKMVYAGWTKGTTALLAALFATARAEGVDAEILAEWEKSVPDAPVRLARGVPMSARKAWRFTGEMREIAATLEAAGLPGDFHRGAADVYERLAGFKDAEAPPELEKILEQLLGPGR